MVKKNGLQRLLAFLIVFAVILSVLPAVFSEEAQTEETVYGVDKLWRQIDNLSNAAAKRGVPGEAAFASISDKVYALVEASDTAAPHTLAANGSFISWVDRETQIPCCYSPEQEAAKAGMSALSASDTAQEILRSAAPTRTASLSDCPQSLNVGLLQPYWESNASYYDASFRYYSSFFVQQANQLAQKTGGELIHFTMENVTPDTVAYTLQNCGFVMINTHGITDYSNGSDKTSRANSSYLCLTINSNSVSDIVSLLHEEDYKTTHTGPFGTYYDVYYGSGYYCINGTVIANHMTADAPNSLFYIGCCLGMATDGIIAPLREKGVETAIGFSQSVTFKGDYSYMMSVTQSFSDGDNLAEAMAEAKQNVGITDPYKTKDSCYPIVVSTADVYPGHGYVDAPQAVSSSWHLSTHQLFFSVPSAVEAIPAVYLGDGDTVILPAAGEVDDYTFAGWSTTPVGHETVPPTLMLSGEGYAPSYSTTIYAVYTWQESHTGGYRKVTTQPSLFSGKYLIVYEDDGIAFNASASDVDGAQNYISVTIDQQHHISSDASVEAAAVTIQRVSKKSYYSIQLPNNQYIGNRGNSAGINHNQSFSEELGNMITLNAEDQTFSIRNQTDHYTLLYYSTTNRFSYYKADALNSNHHAVSLYHRESNSLIDMYTSAPDTSCEHTVCSVRVITPTCVHDGYTSYTCNECGASWTTNHKSARGHFFNNGVKTPATSGSFGYTTYTCLRSGCGYSYQTDFVGLDYQVTLNVRGEDWMTILVNSYDGAVLPDPDGTVSGYEFAGWSAAPILSESATADLITDLYYPMAESTVYAVYSRRVDGVLFYSTVQTELKIYSASLILNGKIDIAFTAQLPAGYSNPRMIVNGTELAADSADRGTYVFVYTGVNPQCIGDSFTATLCAMHDGTEESVSIENYSVRQYCVNKLRDGTISDELRCLLSDLLAYGEAAQFYTGYKLDTLITDGDDISDPRYSFTFYVTGYRVRFEGAAEENTRWLNAGLTLSDSVAMRLRFYAVDTDGLEITVSLNNRTRTYSAADLSALDGMTNVYEISFDDVCAEEFADNVTARFTKNGTTVGNTLYYSVNAYVQSNLESAQLNLANLVLALYNYGESARAYAGK